MQSARLRLGQLLVDAHILTPLQLEDVLARQKSDGRKLGTLLVETGFVTEAMLTQILSQQLSVPWVSLYHIDFSRELWSRVPRDIAEKYCLVPIYVRAVRKQGDTLYVAMEDPMNDEALRDCAASSGLPTLAMIASATDIRRAIRLCYGAAEGVDPSSPVASEARPGTLPSGKVAAETSPAEASAPVSELAEPDSRLAVRVEDDDTPVVEVHEVKLSKRSRKRGRQLTLLDGTTVKIPTAPSRAPGARRRSDPSLTDPAAKDELTAADLLAALRAAAHGVDAGDIFGETLRWEKAMAALLSLLLRKHLILERELLDELKKI